MFSRKKRFAFIVVLLAAVLSETGCGAISTESEVPVSDVATEAQVATELPTTKEMTLEEETTAKTEEETVPETEEMISENSEEADITANEIPTNGELLSMINNAFGIMTDNTVDGNIQAAKDWDIISESDAIDADAKITVEFLISASMRATGFVTGSSTMTEIIECAVQSGVIESTDLSAFKLSQASEIVEKAKYAWAHQEFNNEIHVELCDGVVDLTDMTGSYLIKGDVVVLPSEYAEGIEVNTVYILPKDDSGQGGAYKANTITDNGDGSITIQGTPAEISEVYQTIASS